jgi:protein TonB
VAALFPARAKAAGVTRGDVTLSCAVQAGGRVGQCSVARETPPVLGFGDAVLALAPSFAMSAWTSDGRPVDGARVRIPIRYEP